jgi:integrase
MSAPSSGRRRLGTVADVIDEFLSRTKENQKGRIWDTHRTVLADFKAAKGLVAVDDLICDDLEKFIEDHPAWKSAWTKKRVAQTVKRAFSWCWLKGLIDRHPFKGVSYQQGERGKPMSEEHFRMLLRDTTAEFRRVLLFLWWTGCRPGELCALEWGFIDTERQVAVLEKHKTARSRKDRAPRIICLPEKAIRLLAWLARTTLDQTHVFLNNCGRPWDRNSLGLRMYRMRQRLGIPVGVKLHGCRHSFATRLLLAGTELKTTSVLMGHTSTKMCEHYVHIAGETKYLLDALEKGLANRTGKKKTP